MKTQIKQLLYGILATICFGLSCTSLTWAKEEYQWPPKDGEPIVTLLGPVYETGSETKAPLFKALEQAMTTIVENQQTHLPKSFQQRIAGLKHQLFRPGYSNDEEWGSIKSLGSKAEDYDKESMAGILETSEYRKPGLEMAIRMQPTIDPQPASITLEGYRLVLQPSGKGQAEWFTEEVKLAGRNAGEAFRKALLWELVRPFKKLKTWNLPLLKLPYWKKNILGVISFPDQSLSTSEEPLLRKWVEWCRDIGISECQIQELGNSFYAKIPGHVQVSGLCSRLYKNVVTGTLEEMSKETYLRLHFVPGDERAEDMETLKIAAGTVKLRKAYGHQYWDENTSSGAVWCTSSQVDTYFNPRPAGYILQRDFFGVSIYTGSGSTPDGIVALDKDVSAYITKDSDFPVSSGTILDHSFLWEKKTGEVVSTYSIRPYKRWIPGLYLARYVIQIHVKGEQFGKDYQVPVLQYGLGVLRQGVFGANLGFSRADMSLKGNVSSNQAPWRSYSLTVGDKIFYEVGLDLPLYFVNGRWGAYWGSTKFGFRQGCSQTANLSSTNTCPSSTKEQDFQSSYYDIRYHLRFGGMHLYFGSRNFTGGKASFYDDNWAVQEVVIGEGNSMLMGMLVEF